MASKKQKLTILDMDQGTPEWREARASRITGSRIAAVLGLSPFQSRNALLQEMVKESIGIFSNASSPQMTWGTDHEDEARRAAEFELGIEFEVPGMVTNSKYPMLGYSPDGIHWDNKFLLEVKCPWGLRNDEDPQFKKLEEVTHYWHQVQMGMLVCDLDEAVLYQWAPGGSSAIFIARDHDYWDEIKPHVEAFMQELKDSLADEELIETLSSREDKDWLLATEDYKIAKGLMDHASAQLDKAKQAILALAPRGGHGNGVKVSPVVTKGRVDYAAAIKKLAPDADLEPFTKPATESLRITVSKE